MAYARAFKEVFSCVTKKYPEFKNGKSLEVILVDFDDAQAKGLKEVLGEENSERVLRGCHVHWTRSLQRVCKLVTKTREERNLFLHLGNQIPQRTSKENVTKLFAILCGSCNLLEAKDFIERTQLKLLENVDTQNWKKLKNWSEWWCRPNHGHFQMFTKAFTKLAVPTWKKAPTTTNAIECINRYSIHEKGGSLYALLENSYLEDRMHATK